MMKLIDKIKELFEPKMIVDYPRDFSWMFNKDGSLNVKALKHCPQFYALKKTKQSSVWHKEGNAWNHTLLVYKEMCKLIESPECDIYHSYLTDRDKLVLKLAALCHDLGKATTTYWSEEEQTWKCMNHGLAGEKITRELLYNTDVELREEVCWLVRWHMNFHHFLEKPIEKRAEVIKKLTNGASTIENLLLLNIADCLGSHSDETVDVTDRFFKIKDCAVTFGLYQLKRKSVKPVRVCDDFTAYIMIGLPGSGKDTYIKRELSDCEVICRDDIREEITGDGIIHGEKLLLDKNGEKRVSKIVNERIEKCCAEKKDFIINQTSMSKKTREGLVKQIRECCDGKANPKIVYVLVEAPTVEECVQRRISDGQKWHKIIRQMYDNFEYPGWNESWDELRIEKQH